MLAAGPEVAPIYSTPSWTSAAPSQANFGQLFAALNAARYFELFTRARLITPLFALLGGAVVFAWSSRLYGRVGGLISLSLWCFCPNILAHGRLVTSDVGATALGVGATFAFWLYLRRPSWRTAAIAGVALGFAQLSKFSMLLLLGLWPLLWLVREGLTGTRDGRARRWASAVAHGALIVALSVLVIDLGYGFEGVGRPLGSFDFASRGLLTRPGQTLTTTGVPKHSPNELIDVSWRHRVNRLRGTVLAALPSPLPSYYLSGFDEQKIEADGVPMAWLDPAWPVPGEVSGYPVYLNGEKRRHGWWYYYVYTLAYKVPEGTIFLVCLSLFVLVERARSREAWADEAAVLAVPAVVLLAMSFLTDICLGLRYILPIFPYVHVAAGKLGPWATGRKRWLVAAALGATVLSTARIHPHYLAYFNDASGGPARGSTHLVDSNIDWGQDLVGLREWLRANAPGEPVGFACFGQVNPHIYRLREDGFAWFLPAPLPGTMRGMPTDAAGASRRMGPDRALRPGLYAVSASVTQGLPWRFYDPVPPPAAWYPAWNAYDWDAFGYFRRLKPIAHVGHSILIYRVTPDDARRLAPLFDGPRGGGG